MAAHRLHQTGAGGQKVSDKAPAVLAWRLNCVADYNVDLRKLFLVFTSAEILK